jgi:uncharacterized damage-inducible protein DinB
MYPTLESRGDVLKMLDEIARTRAAILKHCEALTTAQRADPVYPGTWSVLQNLQHLAWVEAYMLASILKRPDALPREQRPPLPALDLPAIRIALDEAHAAVIAFLKSHPEDVLKERCQYGRQGEQTVGGILFHLIEHEFHHRAFILHKLAALAGRATV